MLLSSAAYGVLDAHVAVEAVGLIVAAALGVITAAFGGMMRDMVSEESRLTQLPRPRRRRNLISAVALNGSTRPAAILAFRAGAIQFSWSLPRYKPARTIYAPCG